MTKESTRRQNALKGFIHKIENPLFLDLTKYTGFSDYFSKCDTDVRTSYRKCFGEGFSFARLDKISQNYKRDLWEIWNSISKRQGRPINFMFEQINGETVELKKDEWPVEDYSEYVFNNESLEFYGIFSKEGILVAYLEVIMVGKTGIVHSTLGHFQYLKYGIMKALFAEFIKTKWVKIDRLIYGGADKKDFFKSDLLINKSKGSKDEVKNKK